MIARLVLAGALLAAGSAAGAARVTTGHYGTMKDGREVEQVTLVNNSGMTVKLLNYGGIITDVDVPDRKGKLGNVVLGYGNWHDYETRERKNFFGAIIGRYAGRIANARFTIDGKEVRLQPNDGANALHGGGNEGFESRLWGIRTFREGRTVGAELSYLSPAGEQGFPGNLDVHVTYRLLPDNALRIDYAATSDAPTALNLTNHSYFNMAGAGSGGVANQRLQLMASRYVVSDDRGVPTGAFAPVKGTALDFTQPTAIGLRADAKGPPMTPKGGYNHAWLLDNHDGRLATAAVLHDPASGRALAVLTTEPSLQAYTGDYMDGQDLGAQGVYYHPRDGIAIETQHLADAPNKPDFPTTILRPGETFKSTTIYRFSVR